MFEWSNVLEYRYLTAYRDIRCFETPYDHKKISQSRIRDRYRCDELVNRDNNQIRKHEISQILNKVRIRFCRLMRFIMVAITTMYHTV